MTVKFQLLIILFLILFSCSVKIPIKLPEFPEGTQGAKLKSVLDGKKKVAVIAKELSPNVKKRLDQYGLATEWSETIRAAMKTQLEQFGYYIVVDVDTRNERYNELARTQTGITKTQKALGQELAIDHLFYVNMTAAPRVECKIEIYQEVNVYKQIPLDPSTSGKKEIQIRKTTKQLMGVLYLTIFVEGSIVNIETGKSLSHSVQEPYRVENQPGNIQCPSELVAFSKALESATRSIAEKLSPKVVIVNIPLEEKDSNIKFGDKKLIEFMLEDGVKWVKAGNVEKAIESWESALEESAGTSSSAYWNIAVAKWQLGEMDEAKKYFDLAIKNGGRNFLNSSKRKFIALFEREKRRIEEESYNN